MKVLLVPADPATPTSTEVVDDREISGAIRSLIGGYMEVIRTHPSLPISQFRRPRVTIIANEEGRLTHLPANHRASALAGRFLVGNIVLVGDTVHGFVDIPDEAVALANLA